MAIVGLLPTFAGPSNFREGRGSRMSNGRNTSKLATVLVCAASAFHGATAQESLNPALECYTSLQSSPALKPIAGKVVLSGNTNATLDMQANKAKPTALEKRLC
jgi:hypothetical protein